LLWYGSSRAKREVLISRLYDFCAKLSLAQTYLSESRFWDAKRLMVLIL